MYNGGIITKFILGISRPYRISLLMLLDILVFNFSGFLIFPLEFEKELLAASLLVVFGLFGLNFYSNISSFISINSIFRLIGLCIICVFLVEFFIGIFTSYSIFLNSEKIVPFVLHSSLFILISVIWRILGNLVFYKINHITPASRKVIIFGAGVAGEMVEEYLRSNTKYHPVAIVDDKPSKEKSIIGICKVYPSSELNRLLDELNVDLIVTAIPSLTVKERAELLGRLEGCKAEILLIPELTDLIEDHILVQNFRPVKIEEVLGRETVLPKKNMLEKRVIDQNVLITGAGGSIGSELMRQVSNCSPSLILAVDQSELALYQIEQELKLAKPHVQVIYILGSVSNKAFMDMLFTKYQIDTVFHAAAYKHVPIVENNISSGVYNNIFGTLYCFNAAILHNVRNFILISTDKAVRPTNVMGASKRVAEMIVQSLGARHPDVASGIVRFGNVLGSSGSVIPFFEKQIQNGGPVTLTHSEITRYFMTIPEAAQLVIQASSMATTSDLFLLDMGEPIKIRDLAEKLIHLSGNDIKKSPDDLKGIEIVETGLRVGEKLYEELLIDAEAIKTEHPRIFRATENYLDWLSLSTYLSRIEKYITVGDEAAIRSLFQEIVSGYNPDKNSCSVFEIKETIQ